MAKDLAQPDLIVAVCGAGTMGRGIAQLCAQAGLKTLMFDARDGAVKEAIAAIGKALDGVVQKGRMTAAAKQSVIENLHPIGSLDEVASAGVVIEAIVEDLAVKRDLFRELEKRVAPDAVLATNTSSLSVTEIAAGCARPDRVVGLHFFNPPPLMKLVEVIGGLRTEPALVTAMTGFAKRIGKHPVIATDTPGFVVNHAGRAYGPEALRIVSQGIASPREVDLLMKEAAGFRMGPFELLDLVGGDVAHAVMVSIHGQYFGANGGSRRRWITRPQDHAGLLRLFRPSCGIAADDCGRGAAGAGVRLGRRRGRRQRACGIAERRRREGATRRRAN